MMPSPNPREKRVSEGSMHRILLILFGLLILGACQNQEGPQTTAERCSDLAMEISAAQENDSLQQDAKDEMIGGLEQQRAELNCPP
jgi:hypothetical protein